MNFLDKLFGKDKKDDDWTVTHRGMIREVTYDEIVAKLGRPCKGKGGCVFWRGPLTMVDPEYPDDEFFQLSNKDYRTFGGSKKTTIDGEVWFAYATSDSTIRLIANEVDGLARGIEDV